MGVIVDFPIREFQSLFWYSEREEYRRHIVPYERHKVVMRGIALGAPAHRTWMQSTAFACAVHVPSLLKYSVLTFYLPTFYVIMSSDFSDSVPLNYYNYGTLRDWFDWPTRHAVPCKRSPFFCSAGYRWVNSQFTQLPSSPSVSFCNGWQESCRKTLFFEKESCLESYVLRQENARCIS